MLGGGGERENGVSTHTQANRVLTSFSHSTETQPTLVIKFSHHHLSLRKIIKNNSGSLALSTSGDPTVMGGVKNELSSMVTKEGIKSKRGKLSNQGGLIPHKKEMGPRPSYHCSKHKVTDEM